MVIFSSPGSDIAFINSCHIILVNFNLKHFLSLALFFITHIFKRLEVIYFVECP